MEVLESLIRLRRWVDHQNSLCTTALAPFTIETASISLLINLNCQFVNDNRLVIVQISLEPDVSHDILDQPDFGSAIKTDQLEVVLSVIFENQGLTQIGESEESNPIFLDYQHQILATDPKVNQLRFGLVKNGFGEESMTHNCVSIGNPIVVNLNHLIEKLVLTISPNDDHCMLVLTRMVDLDVGLRSAVLEDALSVSINQNLITQRVVLNDV